MQGKFKLSIIHNVGHSVQEDNPVDTAKMLHGFMRDFRIPMNVAEIQHKIDIGIANFHPNINPY